MKLLYFELKKLCSNRILLLLLSILFIANSFFTYVTASDAVSTSIPQEACSSVYQLFVSDPSVAEEELNRLKEIDEENRKTPYSFAALPQNYTANTAYNDYELFLHVKSRIDGAYNYKSNMLSVCRDAEARIEDLKKTEFNEHGYLLRYENNVRNRYAALSETVRIGLEYSYGYDTWFSYSALNLFICIGVVLVASFSVNADVDNGTANMIRSTKLGRMHLGFSKIMAAMFLSVAFVWLLSVASFAIICLVQGVSSPFNAIQSIDGFYYCPLAVTVGEFIIVVLLLRTLVFAALCSVFVCVTAITKSYAASVAAAFCIYASGVICQNSVSEGAHLHFLNISSAAQVANLFARYRAIPMLFTDIPIDYGTVIVAACVVVLGAFVIGSLYAMAATPSNVISNDKRIRVKNIARIIPKRKKELQSVTAKSRSQSPHKYRSILSFELQKCLENRVNVCAVVLLVVIQCALCLNIYSNLRIGTDEIYRRYMQELSGELTQEKLDYLESETLKVQQMLAEQEIAINKYALGEITHKEYVTAFENNSWALIREVPLDRLNAYADYLKAEEKRSGVTPSFVYGAGWEMILSKRDHTLLFLAITVMLSVSFPKEYDQSGKAGFSLILRSCKLGREELFSTKIIVSAIISGILAVIFSLPQIILPMFFYGLPEPEAPLISLVSFSGTLPSMSIMLYFVLCMFANIVMAVLLGAFVSVISALFKKTIPTLFVSMILIVPEILSVLGINVTEKLNLFHVWEVTPLYTESGLFSYCLTLLMLIIISFAFSLAVRKMHSR